MLRDDKKIVSGYIYEPNCHGKLTIVNVLTDVNTDIWMYMQFTYKDLKYSMICFKNAYHTFVEYLKFNPLHTIGNRIKDKMLHELLAYIT